MGGFTKLSYLSLVSRRYRDVIFTQFEDRGEPLFRDPAELDVDRRHVGSRRRPLSSARRRGPYSQPFFTRLTNISSSITL